MLRVTIDLLPFGIESRKKHLGTIEIANDGTGTAERGNYKVRLAKSNDPMKTWKRGAVADFPRKSKGVYDLLLQALVASVGSRNRRFVAELQDDLPAINEMKFHD